MRQESDRWELIGIAADACKEKFMTRGYGGLTSFEDVALHREWIVNTICEGEREACRKRFGDSCEVIEEACRKRLNPP